MFANVLESNRLYSRSYHVWLWSTVQRSAMFEGVGNPLPSERHVICRTLQGLHLLQRSIVGDTYDGDLASNENACIALTTTLHTFVFLIKAFIDPIPPRSPADIPSTSSSISTVRLVISIPATLVFCSPLSDAI